MLVWLQRYQMRTSAKNAETSSSYGEPKGYKKRKEFRRFELEDKIKKMPKTIARLKELVDDGRYVSSPAPSIPSAARSSSITNCIRPATRSRLSGTGSAFRTRPRSPSSGRFLTSISTSRGTRVLQRTRLGAAANNALFCVAQRRGRADALQGPASSRESAGRRAPSLGLRTLPGQLHISADLSSFQRPSWSQDECHDSGHGREEPPVTTAGQVEGLAC